MLISRFFYLTIGLQFCGTLHWIQAHTLVERYCGKCSFFWLYWPHILYLFAHISGHYRLISIRMGASWPKMPKMDVADVTGCCPDDVTECDHAEFSDITCTTQPRAYCMSPADWLNDLRSMCGVHCGHAGLIQIGGMYRNGTWTEVDPMYLHNVAEATLLGYNVHAISQCLLNTYSEYIYMESVASAPVGACMHALST